MPRKILTLEELQEALQAAQADAEEVEAALQMVDADTPEEQVDELQARFSAKIDEAAHYAEAVARKEQMQEALSKVPRNANKSKDDGPRITLGKEPSTYRKGGPNSFFRDVFSVQMTSAPGALSRLTRNSQELKIEQ